MFMVSFLSLNMFQFVSWAGQRQRFQVALGSSLQPSLCEAACFLVLSPESWLPGLPLLHLCLLHWATPPGSVGSLCSVWYLDLPPVLKVTRLTLFSWSPGSLFSADCCPESEKNCFWYSVHSYVMAVGQYHYYVWALKASGLPREPCVSLPCWGTVIAISLCSENSVFTSCHCTLYFTLQCMGPSLLAGLQTPWKQLRSYSLLYFNT